MAMATIQLALAYSSFDLVLAVAICVALAWSAGEYARSLGKSLAAYLILSLIATPIMGG